MRQAAADETNASLAQAPGPVALETRACSLLRWLADVARLAQRRARGAETAELLRQMLERLMVAFGAESGSIALVDDGGEAASVAAVVGLPPDVIGQRIPLGEGILGRVISEGEARLLSGDLSEGPDVDSIGERRTPRPTSAMCWPLVTESGVIGALSLNRCAGQDPFDEHDFIQGGALAEMMSVVLETVKLHEAHQRRIREVQDAYEQLEQAQQQLVQSEKLASVGQLAAGVAHEINNPIGYISSNLNSLQGYVADIARMLEVCVALSESDGISDEVRRRLQRVKEETQIEFVLDDLGHLVAESQEGVDRVRAIVQDLKDFSRVHSQSWEVVDLHSGIDSTLNIAWNELKHKAVVHREYADLPAVECMPSQINQVCMNLLVNAAQAIDGKGVVYVRTGTDAPGEHVWIEVEDTGQGIESEHLSRVFDPFFTTKAVGTGTGLGLSLSYRIVKDHGGEIEVDSTPGAGTRFRVWLPVRQDSVGATSANVG